MDKTKSLKSDNSSQGEYSLPPEETVYQKPLKPKKIEDKTGWKVRPENEMIMHGKLTPADKGNTLIPEGFDQPSANKPKGKK